VLWLHDLHRARPRPMVRLTAPALPKRLTDVRSSMCFTPQASRQELFSHLLDSPSRAVAAHRNTRGRRRGTAVAATPCRPPPCDRSGVETIPREQDRPHLTGGEMPGGRDREPSAQHAPGPRMST
jgi:hypothetical protein